MGTGIRLTRTIINLYDRSSNNCQKQKVTKSCFSTSSVYALKLILFPPALCFLCFKCIHKMKIESENWTDEPCAGASLGGGGLCVPLLVQFLSVSGSFRQKFCKVIGWRTPAPGNPRSIAAVSGTLTLAVWPPSV